MSEEKVEYAKPLPDFRPETKPFWEGTKPVSYTHLTLPTTPYV